jgi:hypothetical protein
MLSTPGTTHQTDGNHKGELQQDERCASGHPALLGKMLINEWICCEARTWPHVPGTRVCRASRRRDGRFSSPALRVSAARPKLAPED